VANKDPFGPKQLIDAAQITEFGGVEMTDEFMNEGPSQRDYLYVPGASDARYNRDCDLAALHRGEIKGRDVRTLDWNARWFRTIKGTGSDPDNTRVVHARNQGYRPATKADLGTAWLTELPPGGMIAPDGTIKTAGGDLALFVADKQTAARNAMRKKMKAENAVDGLQFEKGGLGDIGKKVKDADPYVTRSVGAPAKGDNQ
jgi:hypothetical protein